MIRWVIYKPSQEPTSQKLQNLDDSFFYGSQGHNGTNLGVQSFS